MQNTIYELRIESNFFVLKIRKTILTILHLFIAPEIFSEPNTSPRLRSIDIIKKYQINISRSDTEK